MQTDDPRPGSDLPATERSAELAALRLGSGQLGAQIEQVAELLARGELGESHPWPASLVWRRLRDLGDIDRVVSDDVLAPLLELRCAVGVIEAVASRDPSGRVAVLAEVLGNIA
jgi:hypothetical protein